MSIHNICFYWEIRKIAAVFGWKKCLICCYVWRVPIEESNQPISLHSLIRVLAVHTKKLHPWLTEMHPVKFWSDSASIQANLNLSLGVHFWRYIFWHFASYWNQMNEFSPRLFPYALILAISALFFFFFFKIFQKVFFCMVLLSEQVNCTVLSWANSVS